MKDKTMENKKYKVLFIEDDELDRIAFTRMVQDRKLPYDCIVAKSVAEAKNILSFERFELVISDHSLGDGTAFDILGSVEDTPVILVTGAGDEEIAVKAWRTGAYDYIIKDVDRNYLKALPITVENVMKHKQTEDKLRLLSAAIMSTADSVYITDMENTIIFVNTAFCKAYGYKPEQVIGKDSGILWIQKSQNPNTRSVFRIGRKAWQVGFYHRKKDGTIFPVSLTRSIVKDSSRKEIAVVGVIRDISDHILMEDELRTANCELKTHEEQLVSQSHKD